MNQSTGAAAPPFDVVRFVRQHPLLVAAAICMAVAFGHPAYSMYVRWVHPDSYYSHGFLVPLVSLWLVWRDRKRLAALPLRSWRPGLALAVLGVLCYFVGEYQASAFPSYVALILILIGAVGYLCGSAVLRACLFPILFLVFMLPMPGNVVAKLTYWLKYAATDAAVGIVHAMGIICMQSGSQIVFIHNNEAVPLTVGDVCSGLRSLIALLALGALFAYISRHRTPGKLLLFVLSVPIAFGTNVLRILVLCLVAANTGYVAQWVHDVTGYMIYAVALALLFAVEWAIGRFRRAEGSP